MKIFAISDTHGNLDGLNPQGSDLVIMAGDLAPLRGWNERALVDQVLWMNTVFSDWCGRFPKTEFRMIPGNHDLFAAYDDLLSAVRLPRNAKLLIDSVDEVNGLRIYGTPWVPGINGRWAFEENVTGLLRRKFAAIPNDVDILLTHTPPKIPGKKVDVSIERQSPHFGSVELMDAINACRPRYVLCGHIHTGDHESITLGHNDGSSTIVRNVSRLDEEYMVRYEPFVFEWSTNDRVHGYGSHGRGGSAADMMGNTVAR